MTIVTGLMVYAIVWWLVWFMVLPFGNRPPEVVEEGHAESAPERPRLWIKAGVTTAVSLVVFAVIYWIVEAGIISFRDSV